jgi:hypothetical protein
LVSAKIAVIDTYTMHLSGLKGLANWFASRQNPFGLGIMETEVGGYPLTLVVQKTNYHKNYRTPDVKKFFGGNCG